MRLIKIVFNFQKDAINEKECNTMEYNTMECNYQKRMHIIQKNLAINRNGIVLLQYIHFSRSCGNIKQQLSVIQDKYDAEIGSRDV